jgi:O-antigen/teichoic acid export membrane protein
MTPEHGSQIPSEGHRLHLSVRALARGGALAFLGSAFSGVVGFVFVVIVTRSLGVAEAGTLLEAVVVATLVGTALTLGADTGLVRAVAQYRDARSWNELRAVVGIAIRPVALVSLVSSAVLFVVAPSLGGVLVRGGSGDFVAYLRVMSLSLAPAAVMLAALSGARGFGSMLPYVGVSNVLVPSLRLALLAACVALGFGGLAVAVSWSAPLVVGGCVAAAVIVRLARGAGGDPIALGPNERRLVARRFWRFSLPRGLANLLQSIVIWVIIVLVGALHSAREAGIMAAAARWVTVGAVAMQAIGLATAPLVATALSREDHDEAQLLFRVGAWWLVILSWPVYLSLIVFAPFLLRIFGPGFVEGRETLVILSVGMMVQVGTGNNKIVLLMGGRSGWNLIFSAIALIVLLALAAVLIPAYGAAGGALAWTTTFVLDNVLNTIAVRRLLGIDPFGRGYVIATLAAVSCFGLLALGFRSVFGPTGRGFVLFSLTAIPLYAAVLWRFRRRLQLHDLVRGLRARGTGAEAQMEALG